MQRVGRPSPGSPPANPRATERSLSAWTTRRCRAGAAPGSAGLAAAQQAGVRHSHVRSETRDPFPCTLTKEPGALGRSRHPAPSPHLGAPGGAFRCDLEGEGRPPSQEPSTRTLRREQWGVHGGPELSGGNSEALPPPQPAPPGLDSTANQEGGRKLRGGLRDVAAGAGEAGYRSGGSELGSSAHTTSRACSRASALSTRRAARRGLPSARLGTCASSPRTKACTWQGEQTSGHITPHPPPPAPGQARPEACVFVGLLALIPQQQELGGRGGDSPGPPDAAPGPPERRTA